MADEYIREEQKEDWIVKEYLGDGVYATLTKWGSIILTTEDGILVQNIIVLEPEVIRSFNRFTQRWQS